MVRMPPPAMSAAPTYSPLFPQNTAEFLRPYPCRHVRYAATHPVQPLKGLPGTRATGVSYRALAPGGAGFCYRICTGTSKSRPTAHYSLLTANSTYTFSAKEKDSETGLSHFGSRYYSSDLSVWLSVDPMSDKYPHQSNYVYCSNNPLKVIDPDGEDEWEVNEVTGQVQHYSNNNPDKLFVTTAYGQRRDDVAPLDVDREVMQQLFSDETLTAFAGTNKRDEMSKMFDYLADNTYVEWTHVGASFTILNKDGCSTLTSDLLFTRHLFTSCSMRGTLEDFAENGVLDFHKHSHPNKYLGLNPYYREVYPSTSHIPSRSDIANKNSYPWGVPFRQPFFLLRNGKRNIYY